jgi:hypothetical protein
MLNLNELDEFLLDKEYIPDPIDIIYYLFWEKGFSMEQVNELPIPYIMSIVSTHGYVKKKEKESLEKKTNG